MDCENNKCWTSTADLQYTWGINGINQDGCIGDGSSYPACHYCDVLDYGNFLDWVLPDITALAGLCGSDSCSGPCFGGEGYSNLYWSSSAVLMSED